MVGEGKSRTALPREENFMRHALTAPCPPTQLSTPPGTEGQSSSGAARTTEPRASDAAGICGEDTGGEASV